MLDNIQEDNFFGERMKILTIDDDPAMTDLLKLVLIPMKATVISANSGDEGLRLLREKNPDIVILDLMNPQIKFRSHTYLVGYRQSCNGCPCVGFRC
jgi:CheY-like chemotaxis protein